MAKTYYHGGRESNWVAEDESYAAGYADMNGGGLTELTIDVSEDDVLDLTEAGYDAVKAAAMLCDLGFACYGTEDEDTHCVICRIFEGCSAKALDLQIAIEEKYKAIRLEEWTDGVGETTSLLILDRAIITSEKELV